MKKEVIDRFHSRMAHNTGVRRHPIASPTSKVLQGENFVLSSQKVEEIDFLWAPITPKELSHRTVQATVDKEVVK